MKKYLGKVELLEIGEKTSNAVTKNRSDYKHFVDQINALNDENIIKILSEKADAELLNICVYIPDYEGTEKQVKYANSLFEQKVKQLIELYDEKLNESQEIYLENVKELKENGVKNVNRNLIIEYLLKKDTRYTRLLDTKNASIIISLLLKNKKY